MLAVKPVSRQTIESWAIADSGLPVRVFNSARAAGINSVGELRTWSDTALLDLRSLGRISLGHIRSFFELCDRIEKGQQSFENVRQVFDIFLDEDEMNVLSARYGFERESLRVSRKYMTLQEIGNRDHRTRERVRQIEETAKRKLSSKLGFVCFQPFYGYFRAILDSLGKTASGSEIAPLVDRMVMAGYNPCSVLLLLCDLDPSQLTAGNQFFSTVPAGAIEDVQRRVLRVLEGEKAPVHLQAVMAQFRDISAFGEAEAMRKAVAVVMEHEPQVAATVDRQYFLYSRGTNAFLADTMRKLSLPAHFRAITQAVNDRLLPQCRKGAGFVLEALNAHPQCARVDRGIYNLQPDARPAAGS